MLPLTGDLASPLRFIVLSQPRSGTHLLKGMLESHPRVICHGEVFKPGYLERREPDLADLPNAHSVLHFLLDKKPIGGNAVGLVLHDFRDDGAPRFNDAHRAIRLLDPPPLLIWLRRENRVAQLASWCVAHRTGSWKTGTGQREPRLPPEGSLDPDPERFADRVIEWERKRRDLETLLEGCEGIQVSYERLCRQPDYLCNRIFHALRLAPSSVRESTAKQREYRLPYLFRDYEAILEALVNRREERMEGAAAARRDQRE